MISSFILLIEWEDKINALFGFQKEFKILNKVKEEVIPITYIIIHHLMESRTCSFGFFFFYYYTMALTNSKLAVSVIILIMYDFRDFEWMV